MYSERIKKQMATGENADANDLGPDYWALIWELKTENYRLSDSPDMV
jgi:hypothetical protein